MRPVLQKLIGSLRAGQVRVVYKLDRIARSLTEPIDTSTSVAALVFQILGAVAGYLYSVCEIVVDIYAQCTYYGYMGSASLADNR